MAVPVIETSTTASGTPSSSLVISKPTGVTTGDLLVILCGNDDDTVTAQWDDSTLKPTGFTLIQEAGGSTFDAHVAAFWRIADGTEGSTFTIPAASSDDMYAWCLRISGFNASNPINVVGTSAGVSGAALTIPAATTTVNDCLGMFVVGFDGGDTTLSVTSPWIAYGTTLYAGLGNTNGCGLIGTKSITSAGTTDTAGITTTTLDGKYGFIFAIEPAAGGTDDDAALTSIAISTSLGAVTASGTSNATATPSTVIVTTSIPSLDVSNNSDASPSLTSLVITTAIPAVDAEGNVDVGGGDGFVESWGLIPLDATGGG